MVAKMAVVAGGTSSLFALSLIACSATPDTPLHTPRVPPQVFDAGVTDAEQDGVSEVEARLLLNQMFRDAGLRIVNDYPFRKTDIEVTLDGYDPERGIGFEYLAPSERGADLSQSEGLALANEDVFLVNGGSLEELERAAERFLSRFSSEIPNTSAGTNGP